MRKKAHTCRAREWLSVPCSPWLHPRRCSPSWSLPWGRTFCRVAAAPFALRCCSYVIITPCFGTRCRRTNEHWSFFNSLSISLFLVNTPGLYTALPVVAHSLFRPRGLVALTAVQHTSTLRVVVVALALESVSLCRAATVERKRCRVRWCSLAPDFNAQSALCACKAGVYISSVRTSAASLASSAKIEGYS